MRRVSILSHRWPTKSMKNSTVGCQLMTKERRKVRILTRWRAAASKKILRLEAEDLAQVIVATADLTAIQTV